MSEIFKSPLLYRGDSLPSGGRNFSSPNEKGRTWAEYYKSQGLMAKFNSGGDQKFWNHSMAYLVSSHVGYERHPDPKKVTPEQHISNKSPFISFSTDLDRAGYFMDRTLKAKLTQSSLDDATHFVWKMEQIECLTIELGRYSFTYLASLQNVEAFLKDDLSQIKENFADMEMSTLGPLLGGLFAAANTFVDKETHFAELIDVRTFLENTNTENLDTNLVERAYKRSQESSEWLLFPKDNFGALGYSSQFTLNAHLSLQYWANRV